MFKTVNLSLKRTYVHLNKNSIKKYKLCLTCKYFAQFSWLDMLCYLIKRYHSYWNDLQKTRIPIPWLINMRKKTLTYILLIADMYMYGITITEMYNDLQETVEQI